MSDQERIEAKLRLESQFHNGASWFYWIAGLSLLNTGISLFNGSWGFISGLGITQLIDAFAYGFTEYFGKGAMYAGVFIDLLIIAVFFVLGKLAYNRIKWAIIAGLVLYGIDALTFIFITDYLSIGFHVLAIYSIFRGIQAVDKLTDLENMEQLSSDEDAISNDNIVI